MQKLSLENSWGIRSMVFPRNQVAFTHLLGQYGIERFRPSTEGDGLIYRIGSLLREFNVRTASEILMDGQAVPAGHFVNWRSGARLVVPPSVTLLRWKQILKHAARTGRCAHLWFHPHNLITGRQQEELVAEILKAASSYVCRGDLSSKTFRSLQNEF
jgi:hypothetical protein